MRHEDEMDRRLSEIRSNPVLSRRMDALRSGDVSKIPINERFEIMRRDRIEEIRRERVGAR